MSDTPADLPKTTRDALIDAAARASILFWSDGQETENMKTEVLLAHDEMAAVLDAIAPILVAGLKHDLRSNHCSTEGDSTERVLDAFGHSLELDGGA